MGRLWKLFAGLSILAAACSPDRVQRPGENNPLFEIGSEPPPDDCETQIIVSDGCPAPDEGYVPPVFYYDSVPGLSSTLQVPPTNEVVAVTCPRSNTGIVHAWVGPPVTRYQYGVTSSGTWILDLIASAAVGWPFSSQGIYNWPYGPYAGYWPARNVSLGTDAEVFISQVRARCDPVPRPDGTIWVGVQFVTYYGVRVRENDTRVSPGGGGGGGGGGDGCTYEFVILEINYGDGTGWHELWRGYALVCG